jgi:hypothetical protein
MIDDTQVDLQLVMSSLDSWTGSRKDDIREQKRIVNNHSEHEERLSQRA